MPKKYVKKNYGKPGRPKRARPQWFTKKPKIHGCALPKAFKDETVRIPKEKLINAIRVAFYNPPKQPQCRERCHAEIISKVEQRKPHPKQQLTLQSMRTILKETRYCYLNEDWPNVFRCMKFYNSRLNDLIFVSKLSLKHIMFSALLHAPNSTNELLESFVGAVFDHSKHNDLQSLMKEIATIQRIQEGKSKKKEIRTILPMNQQSAPISVEDYDFRDAREMCNAFKSIARHSRSKIP